MLMDSYIFSILHKVIEFSLPLNPAIHRMDNAPNILCLGCEKQKEPWTLIYILLQAFQNVSRILTSELLINLKQANTPFRITLKTIIMETSSQFHDGALLKMYPNLAHRCYTLLDWAQETFVKTWSSLLNNNGNLNVESN